MSTSKAKITLKKNKIIDKIWHPESTLVFKSSTEKKVIGRCVDDEFISLDEEGLSLCEKWGFKYDTDLVDEEGKSVEEQTSDHDDDAEKPVAEKPVAEKPVAEKPVAEKPVAEKPVAEKQSICSTTDRFMSLAAEYNSSIQLLLSDLLRRNEILEKELHESKNNEEKLKIKFKQLKSMFE